MSTHNKPTICLERWNIAIFADSQAIKKDACRFSGQAKRWRSHM